jgi:hypothetical protein
VLPADEPPKGTTFTIRLPIDGDGPEVNVSVGDREEAHSGG